MRKVIVSTVETSPDKTRKVVERGWAWFHDFGLDFEELQGGVANFTTAVVEWPDGTLENVPLMFVKFLEPYIDQQVKMEVHLGDSFMLFNKCNQAG